MKFSSKGIKNRLGLRSGEDGEKPRAALSSSSHPTLDGSLLAATEHTTPGHSRSASLVSSSNDTTSDGTPESGSGSFGRSRGVVGARGRSGGGRSSSVAAGPRSRGTSRAASKGGLPRSRSASTGARPRYVAPASGNGNGNSNANASGNGSSRQSVAFDTTRAPPSTLSAIRSSSASSRTASQGGGGHNLSRSASTGPRYVAPANANRRSTIGTTRAPPSTISNSNSDANTNTNGRSLRSDSDDGFDDFLMMLAKEKSQKELEVAEEEADAGKTKCPVAHQHGTAACPVAHDAGVKKPKPVGPVPGGGRCPFKHGTVYSGPYPGYVHGNPKRPICPHGCRPALNSDITSTETPKDTLLREAVEFLELYYHERSEDMKGTPDFLAKEERIDAVTKSIGETGTYEHTFDEIQHGARVAWRNAPKCANRKYWGQLKLLDRRDVDTNKGMFDACIQHLAKAMTSGSSETYITVFKPAPPGGERDGPRIWNDQLLQYAAYGHSGEVMGDPAKLRFTEMLKERFGWDGPSDGKQGPYDYLPLVMQANPDEPPELFDVPLEVAPPVYIHHPHYPELSGLGMRWYPIPAVSALDMTLGGLLYTAVPFNGWYASTEVLRDLTDADRYNMLKPVAEALGMDPNTKPGEAPLWIDDVMAILSRAVYHSFKTAKIAMIDHHTLINMFWTWYHDELKHRKYCPVNWKWVIPPMSSTTNPAYMGLNKAQEYTLKPAYIVGKGFVSLEERHFGPRDTTKAVKDLLATVYLAILFKRMVNKFRGRKQPVLIIYASVTGNAAKYASDLGTILRSGCNVSFFDACGANAASDDEILPLLRLSSTAIFVTSTQGNGLIPPAAENFFSFLFDEQAQLLKGKQCAVLGFGSSAYPIFCGGASYISRKLTEKDADQMIPMGKCDAVKGEAQVFFEWTGKLVETMASLPSAGTKIQELAENIKENTASVLAEKQNMTDYVNVEVFTVKEVEMAAAKAFMQRRKRSQDVGDEGASTRLLVASQPGSVDEEEMLSRRQARLIKIISSTGRSNDKKDDNKFVGVVTERQDLISNEAKGGESHAVTRKTSLVKINLESCGNPPYQPGDHIRVFPQNVVGAKELQGFITHFTGNLSLDDNIFVSFKKAGVSSSELAVSLPLLSESVGQMISLDYFFEKQVALLAPISMQACKELANLATAGKDKSILTDLGEDAREYERMNSMTGLRWIDLFLTFPSMTKQVSLNFLLVNMSMNHPRSYSISSCKATVGSELHLTVGRFLYSRGGSKTEVGVCSSFLTSVQPGDEIQFKLESAPSFHHPIDPSCPIIFVCAGTGFAPMRGLLQKRSYFQERGEKMGPSYLIYGSRCSNEVLFQEEIRALNYQGALTKTFMCYSREPGKPKEYVSDRIKSDRVKRLLAPLLLGKSNTHIYICGSANLAEQTKSVLKEISSESCMEKINSTGRLHQDVFGALALKNLPGFTQTGGQAVLGRFRPKRSIGERTKSVAASITMQTPVVGMSNELLESSHLNEGEDESEISDLSNHLKNSLTMEKRMSI